MAKDITMSDLLFITSKPDKVRTLQSYLQKAGLTYTVSLGDADIPEPQGRSIVDIAEQKALLAYRQLRQPVVVEDSGFYIDALNGFPGPYVKYVLDTIGLDGLMRLVAGKTDRGCRFVSAVSLVDAQGKVHTFVDESSTVGTLAEIAAAAREDMQSLISRLFIPQDFNKPLAAMSPTELNAYWAQRVNLSAMMQLVEALPNLTLRPQKEKTRDLLAR